MTWVVYILQSSVSLKLYTGISNNVVKRLAAHNAGKGAKFTRTGRPWVLIYTEPCENRSEATKREYAIKRLSRDQRLTLAKGWTALEEPRPVEESAK